MLRKIRYSMVVIALLSLLTFLNNGCGNASQNSVQTKNETEETESLITPQYELIETPEYKALKQQVEKARNEVNELEIQRASLLVKYTAEYPAVKKISSKLKEAEKRLAQLETLLAEETEKLEKQSKKLPA